MPPERSHCFEKCHNPATTTLIKVMGNMNFQAKLMSWSMRKRGSVPRIQMNRKISAKSLRKNQMYEGIQSRNAKGDSQPPRNRVMPKLLTAKRPKYSAIKNMAYLNPEYSIK